MAHIHDPQVFESVATRLNKLTPESRPMWGKMSVGQMLWHVNQALGTALGHVQPANERAPIPSAIIRFATLNLPWIKNAPTNSAFVPKETKDFHVELARTRQLLAEIKAQDIDTAPPMHPMFGQMSGRDQSRLHAKHLDHHLRQFGV